MKRIWISKEEAKKIWPDNEEIEPMIPPPLPPVGTPGRRSWLNQQTRDKKKLKAISAVNPELLSPDS